MMKLKRLHSSLTSYEEITEMERLPQPEFWKNKKQHDIGNDVLSSFVSEEKEMDYKFKTVHDMAVNFRGDYNLETYTFEIKLCHFTLKDNSLSHRKRCHPILKKPSIGFSIRMIFRTWTVRNKSASSLFTFVSLLLFLNTTEKKPDHFIFVRWL